MNSQSQTSNKRQTAHWGAVRSMAFGVAGITAAEMMPISLLTSLARDLAITKGAAGQSVTAVAVFGFVTSLLMAVVTRKLDRRPLLIALSLIQVLSSIVAALSQSLIELLLGRALLRISLGGFWALSASLALRLVPKGDVPKALAIIFGGVSVATIAAGPIGSLLGGIVGSRGVFWIVTVFSALTCAAQIAVLPSMPPRGVARFRTIVDLLKRRSIRMGMAGVMLSFAGHFAFFTYLRPYLEGDVGLGVQGGSALLFVFGAGVFIGTSLVGPLLGRDLRLTMLAVTTLMTLVAVVLIAFGRSSLVAGPAVFLWGAAFGFIPIGWSTWLTQAVPDEAESGGGLLVAVIQVAISAGAGLGGLTFDLYGTAGAFGVSGALMFAAAIIIVVGLNFTATLAAVAQKGA